MAFEPFEQWVSIDLTAGPRTVTVPNGFFTQDNNANKLGVRVFNGGEPHQLTGSIGYYAKLADGTTLEGSGTRSGNEGVVILPSEAFAVVGMLSVAVFNKDGNDQKVLAVFVGYVHETKTDSEVVPGSVVADLAELAAQYQEMIAATNAAITAAELIEGNFTEAHGFQVGTDSTATGANSAAIGWANEAEGASSSALGSHTIANHAGQHVFGAYNEEDPSENGAAYRGDYIEIVGNGLADNDRSNARTLDWQGNEVLAGEITANGVNLNQENIALKTAVFNLPDGYTRMAYCESDGDENRRVSLGFKANQDTRIVCTFQYAVKPENESNAVFGNRLTSTSQAYYFGSGPFAFFVGYNTETSGSPPRYFDKNVHTVDLNKNNIYFDGLLWRSFSAGEFESYKNIAVFGLEGRNSSSHLGCPVRIYDMIVYDDGVLTHHYIPAKRNSDGKLGLYDTVGSAFKLPLSGNLTGEPAIAQANTEIAKDGLYTARAVQRNIAPFDLSIARRNHEVGEFIIVNDQLYEVTGAIASGETITPGTNCTEVPGGLADQISNLKTYANTLHNLVNYGYDIPAKDTTGTGGCVAERNGPILTLNGTQGGGTVACYRILSGNYAFKNSASIIEQETNLQPVILKNGHVYRVHTKEISGTAIRANGDVGLVNLAAYFRKITATGTESLNTLNGIIYNNDKTDKYCDFLYTDENMPLGVCIVVVVYRASNNLITFTNYKIAVYIEDITNGAEEDVFNNLAPIESGTASTNYSVGDLMVYNQQLYEVSDAIASGETITPGTNVDETSVAEQLSRLPYLAEDDGKYVIQQSNSHMTLVPDKTGILEERLDNLFRDPCEEFYKKYFTSYQNSNSMKIRSNWYWYKSGGQSSQISIHIISAGENFHTATGLNGVSYYTPELTDLIEISKFTNRNTISLEMYREFNGTDSRTAVGVCIAFYIVNESEITYDSSVAMFRATTADLQMYAFNKGEVEIPTTATHFLVAYYYYRRGANVENTAILKIY